MWYPRFRRNRRGEWHYQWIDHRRGLRFGTNRLSGWCQFTIHRIAKWIVSARLRYANTIEKDGGA